MDNNSDKEFYDELAKVREEMVGREIRIPGHKSAGIVERVDEFGAWLKGGLRIDITWLSFYHPVPEKNSDKYKVSR